MRCPKCQYLSFDNGDRCRNCGYEFSLVVSAAPLDLPIQDGTEPIGPLADLELRDTPDPVHAPLSTPPPAAEAFELPLFTPAGKGAPPIAAPAAPRAPLSVRRNAPAPPKPKAAPAPRLALDTAEMPLVEQRSEQQQSFKDRPHKQLDASTRGASVSAAGIENQAAAPAGARAVAAIIDLAIVGGIDVGVLYLTLRILDLRMADARALPVIPFVAFLLLLNGSYFAAFVAAGGQTIGKMASGIRVVPSGASVHANERVSVGSAIVRAAAYLVSALPAGVGFLPGLMSSDHRALHDRLADTRVVKA